MTAPTPKPDEPPARRKFRIPMPALLACSAMIVFTVFAVALVEVLPSPHSRADYIIVGTLATLAALITIFGGLVLSRGRRRS